MIYNMLDYYISCGNLVEALNILEQFNECYNVCKESIILNVTAYDKT
jgi:hypothetical protein